MSINEIPEPVDFEVSNDDGITWGIEVRNVNKSEEETKGSVDKKDESMLVADRVFGSGRLSLLADVQVNHPGFENIYFLSYPEAIQRIGGKC